MAPMFLSSLPRRLFGQIVKCLTPVLGADVLLPLPALSMVGPPKVKRRIEEVLNEKKNRATAGTAALVLCAAGTAAATIPGAMVALSFQPSPARPDPGTVGNGFRARLPDGRVVELLQISRMAPGGMESWRPDGKPIDAKDAIPAKMWTSDPDGLNFFFRARIQEGGRPINAGMGHGPYVKRGSAGMSFASTIGRRGGDPNERIFVSRVLARSGGSGKVSFAFTLADAPFQTPLQVRFDPRGKVALTGASGRTTIGNDQPTDVDPFKNVKVVSPAKQITGMSVSGMPGGPKPRPGQTTPTLEFFMNPALGTTALELVADGNSEPNAVAFDRSGKEILPSAIEGRSQRDGIHHRWAFRRKPGELSRIEVRTRPSQITEFHEVRLRPLNATP